MGESNVVPLSDESLTPKFLLLDVLEHADDIKALAIVGIDKDGYCKAHWSCPSQVDLCALLVKLQAVVNQVILE